MSNLKLYLTTAGYVLTAGLVGIFGNQISTFFDLPRLWVIGIFLLLLAILVLLQVFTSRAGTIPSGWKGDLAQKGLRRWRSDSYLPLGLILGAVIALAAIHLDKRPRTIVFFGYGIAHPYEVSASVATILACIAYRWFQGADGIWLFGLGGGLGVGVAIVVVAPEANAPVWTIFSHALVVSSVGLSLMATKNRWGYAVAAPLMVVFFASLPSVVAWAWSVPTDEHYSLQEDDHDLFADGRHTIVYEVPFVAPPRLSVQFNGVYPADTQLRIVNQRDSSFTIEVESSEFPISIWFEARGTPVSGTGQE